MPFTGYSSWISLFYVCQYSTAALLFRMKAGNSKSIWRHQNNKTEQTKLRAKQLERLNYRIIHTAEVQKQDIVTSVTSTLQCSHMADVTEMQCVISDSLWPYQILIKSLFSKTLRHHLIMRYFYIARKCESRRINNPQSESLDKLKCFVSISSSLKLRQIIYSIWVSKHIQVMKSYITICFCFFKSVTVDWGSGGLHLMHRYHILILLSSTSSVILKLQRHIRSCYSNIWSWFIDCM